MRRLAPIVFALVVLLALLAGCLASPAEKHPAAKTIARLLELRRDDVRDPKAYAPYFLESELATALAEGSSGEPTGTPRIPNWERPYVSEETSQQASVVVVWKADKDFKDWPAVNVFLLERAKDRWVVVDAVEATTAPAPIGSDDAERR